MYLKTKDGKLNYWESKVCFQTTPSTVTGSFELLCIPLLLCVFHFMNRVQFNTANAQASFIPWVQRRKTSSLTSSPHTSRRILVTVDWDNLWLAAMDVVAIISVNFSSHVRISCYKQPATNNHRPCRGSFPTMQPADPDHMTCICLQNGVHQVLK